MSFKQRSFNAFQGLKKEMHSFPQNEWDRWEGKNHRACLDEDYSSLEQRLNELMKDISNIEEKLTKMRLAF